MTRTKANAGAKDRPELSGALTRLFESDPEIRSDPFPLYRRLREEHPVYDNGSQVLLSSYKSVKSAFLESGKFSNEANQRPGSSGFEAARTSPQSGWVRRYSVESSRSGFASDGTMAPWRPRVARNRESPDRFRETHLLDRGEPGNVETIG